MSDIEVTPRSVFSIQKGAIKNKSLSIVNFIGDNTISGTPTMAIYDSDGTDVTANYGKGTSYASGVITFGVKGHDTGSFYIIFTLTYTDVTPDSTAMTDTIEMVMQVTAAATSAGTTTASTAETLTSHALSTLNDAKIALKIDLTTNTDDTLIVHLINNCTELIESYCRRRFTATSYTNELYDGGGKYLFLRNYPIVTVSRLATDTYDVIRVKNTNTHTVASVSVTSSSVVLRRNGSVDSTLTFASNATISAMATAISAVSGWSAEVTASTFNSYKSNDLLLRYGANAINNNWVDLRIPYDAEDEFTTYPEEGMLYMANGFPRGHKNIIITHNSGYSTIPHDLRFVCNTMVKEFFNYIKNDEGHKSEHIGNYSYSFDLLSDQTRKEINFMLSKFKRHKV